MSTEPNRLNAPETKAPRSEYAADECQRIMRRAHGFYELGLYADAAAELETIQPSAASRMRVARVRSLTAYAMGDMPRVVALGNDYRTVPGQPASFYSALAIALHNCGRWQEAVEAEEMRMRQYGATPDDYYGLACYYGKALQMEPALLHLAKGLHGHAPNCLKALVDSDLQPFWARLPFSRLTPRMQEVLRSPAFMALSRTLLTAQTKFNFDAVDRPRLPAGVGRWMEFDQGSYLLELSPSAPPGIRRRLHEWSLGRARATRHLVRRAVQRALPFAKAHAIGLQRLPPPDRQPPDNEVNDSFVEIEERLGINPIADHDLRPGSGRIESPQ